MSGETVHWASDPYWTDAFEDYSRIRESGQGSICVDLQALEAFIYNGDGPAYKLLEAMCSVEEHEGFDGYRGAPRLVLALLAKLNETAPWSAKGKRLPGQIPTSVGTPVFRARDQVLASKEAVRARLAMAMEPHVAPLQALAERIRESRDAPDGVPRFDPLDGGINARVLLLQEAPGPRAVGSGFVSFDNPDQTAANARHACESAGLTREDVVRWNAVPWYIGNEGGTKIRPATRDDVKRAEPWLAQLLELLPRLQVVVLMGKNAQRLEPVIKRIAPNLRIETTTHCSPLALNYSPERRPALIEKLRAIAVSLPT